MDVVQESCNKSAGQAFVANACRIRRADPLLQVVNSTGSIDEEILDMAPIIDCSISICRKLAERFQGHIDCTGRISQKNMLAKHLATAQTTVCFSCPPKHRSQLMLLSQVGVVVKGCTIVSILPGSPADLSDVLSKGDKIIKVDGRPVSPEHVERALRGCDTLDTMVELTVRKHGEVGPFIRHAIHDNCSAAHRSIARPANKT